MRSPLPLALAALAALCACSSSRSQECPGEEVARLRLTGALVEAACAVDPAGGYAALVPATLTLDLTFSFDAAGGAALCNGKALAAPLTGTHDGDALVVSLETTGGVLSGCASTCAVTTDQQVAGSLLRDGTGAVIGFSGTLTDRQAATASATCGACTTPCTATWALATAP